LADVYSLTRRAGKDPHATFFSNEAIDDVLT
jgi:hypothetical protein